MEPTALYQQVEDYIVRHIQDGSWPPGHVAPEHELVRRFGMSRMTVNRALRDLVQQGRASCAGAGCQAASWPSDSRDRPCAHRPHRPRGPPRGHDDRCASCSRSETQGGAGDIARVARSAALRTVASSIRSCLVTLETSAGPVRAPLRQPRRWCRQLPRPGCSMLTSRPAQYLRAERAVRRDRACRRLPCCRNDRSRQAG